ncbi:MAG TPA: DUF1349 domain-containing protein [Verrucomicrobiae bacterium]|nr:DUF1349 domain-containing protein [Verrucomicrobiae bacterium]
MKSCRTLICLALLAFVLGSSALRAQAYLDTVIFGNGASETAHRFAGANSFVITNSAVSPAQTARRCSTNNPATVNGGSLTFTLTVDPAWRNYVTVKFWGGDDFSRVYSQDSDMGRLYLYVAASNFVAGANTNYQVGYRHEGDYCCLNAAAYKPPLPGRFFYSTTLLPLWMTQGRTNLTLTIQACGRIFDLGSGGPPGGNYQFNMVTNSRGIYQAYTHTDPVLDPVGEVQGTAPATTVRTSPTMSVLQPGGTFYNVISNYLNGRMNNNVTNFSVNDVLQLAKAYSISNFPVTFTNPAVIDKVIAANDYFASNYYANPNTVINWGGSFGDLGWAIDLLSSNLQSSLDVLNNYGAGGTVTRRQAWGDMLAASRDYGRFNRNYLSNQGLICDTSIYWANRGLLDLNNANAFAETNAQRYLLEACGILPWRGPDLSGGGSAWPHGTNYYQVTPKGLTREWGYVGQAYGELAYYAADFYAWTGNPLFETQCVKMVEARAHFRRPTIDLSGSNNYQALEAIGLLAWRGADESDSEFADEMAYGDRTPWNHGMRCAAVTGDTNLVGYAKQMIADGQYFNNLTINYWGNPDQDALNAFADYQTVANDSDGGVRVPMTDGQPDFAWADEEDGIVAIKHGGERLWLETYWQAKSGTGVNGVGRFLYETNNFDRYGVLETSPQINFSGSFYVRANLMDKPEANLYVPPDAPLQAYQGERLPLAANDPLATDDGPFRGKALFWACRYGNFLIGINRSTGKTYELKTPAGFTSATNLIDGQVMTAPVYVPPQSTVILYLNSAVNSQPVPMAPLSLNAVGNATPAIALDWSPASGATGYNVKRATSSGGPYATIANVTSTNYLDASVTRGVTYYYVVSGTNANGESDYNSMENSASAGLPAPWQDTDIGSVGIAGSGDYNNGTFTISGEGYDIGSSSDSGNFAYLAMTNDGTFIARLATEQFGGSADDKVGIMFRESTNANAKVAAVLIDGAMGIARFPTRSSTGGNMSWINGPSASAPEWFKLQRSGNTFTGYVSADGNSWTAVGTNTFTMNSALLAGFIVCSRNAGTLDVSTFDNVSAPSWSPPPIAPATLTATATNMLVTLRWSSVNNASGYAVKRASISGGPYAMIAGMAATNYADANVQNGLFYYYVVTATNAAGESGNSPEAMAQPESLVPPNVSILPAGNQIAFQWPLDHLGWRLEVQTNSAGTGLGTNWTTIANSTLTNQVNLPVNPEVGNVFYRLVYP